jgi:D-lactate dehydrogenase (cytochrome)
MVYRAIELDGTCSGEHGVGLGKVEYLEKELGEGTVGLMETIKRTGEFYSITGLAEGYGRVRRERCPLGRIWSGVILRAAERMIAW